MQIHIETHGSVHAIGEATWQRLLGPDGTPFLEYNFLAALEDTGCVDADSGWYTALVTAATETGDVIGALPLYLKSHSQGEFVYDWGWADAAARIGVSYYPKGVIAAPLTPVTGARLLTGDGEAEPVRRALIAGAIEVARAANLSSLHFNFITEDEVAFFEELGLPIRTQLQYHWVNGRRGGAAHYETFDDYLAQFRAKRRANIRRERRKLVEDGVVARVLAPEELTPEQMRRVYRYYANTVNKFYWGQRYLNEEFFLEVARTMRDRLHIVVAEQHGEQFAGAFNVVKGDRLYGRYWGCTREVEFAHFEVCMYRAIEWAIEHNIEVFEPGHGGEHKHERGFEATKTYSAHWIADARFADAVARFCREEEVAVDRRLALLNEESPLKS